MTDRTFNTDEPLAYFITWTTYGTWLIGDERGSWHAGKEQSPEPLLREMAASAMKEPKFELTPADRQIVEQVIVRHCEVRSWQLHAVAARSNHVHVVVTAPDYAPTTVRDQFKSWCTRKLKTRYPNRKRFWTEGGSCRWINHAEGLDIVIRYVTETQDRKGID